MSGRNRNSVRDNILATVVGGLILAGAVYLIQQFYPPFLAFLKRTFENIAKYFSTFTEIPNGILWLFLFLLIIISVAFSVYVIRAKRNKESRSQPNLGSYNQQLQQEIERLREQSAPKILDLAGLDENIKISGTYLNRQYDHRSDMSKTLSWKQIFSLIAPFLLEHPNDTKMKSSIVPNAIFNGHFGPSINSQDYETIKVHLMALKLISVDYTQTTSGGMALFWSLTQHGQALLMELRSVKKV